MKLALERGEVGDVGVISRWRNSPLGGGRRFDRRRRENRLGLLRRNGISNQFKPCLLDRHRLGRCLDNWSVWRGRGPGLNNLRNDNDGGRRWRWLGKTEKPTNLALIDGDAVDTQTRIKNFQVLEETIGVIGLALTGQTADS
jgi:hypothetical protein